MVRRLVQGQVDAAAASAAAASAAAASTAAASTAAASTVAVSTADHFHFGQVQYVGAGKLYPHITSAGVYVQLQRVAAEAAVMVGGPVGRTAHGIQIGVRAERRI